MSQREYLIDLDVNARVRCWHRTERGKVTAFAIQLETYLDGQWRTVVRYDTAHGHAHRDWYRRDGTQTKTFLGMDFVIARTFAQHDILQQWRRYLQLFMEGRT